MHLIAEPLSAAAFAPYGDVIEIRADVKHFPINYGHTERYHDLANIDVNTDSGKAIVSLFRSQPLPLPIAIRLMERHPLGSQAFIPLSGRPYLVVVAQAGDFSPANLRAFVAAPTQGVNYQRGTWHHFCLALEASSDFLVIDRSGPGSNCDEIPLDELDIWLDLSPTLPNAMR